MQMRILAIHSQNLGPLLIHEISSFPSRDAPVRHFVPWSANVVGGDLDRPRGGGDGTERNSVDREREREREREAHGEKLSLHFANMNITVAGPNGFNMETTACHISF